MRTGSSLSVHRVTSSKVHEEAYDGWQSGHLRLILSSLREVLHEIYVEPTRRKLRREQVLKLQSEVMEPEQPLRGESVEKSDAPDG